MSHSATPSRSELIATRTAAHSAVAVFDVSDRTQIEVTGEDRARFLHSFTTNDIRRLKPGQGCETFITNLKGKVVAHAYVFCAEKSLWLDGMPGQQDAIIDHLKKFVLIDDVQLVPRGSERGELFLTGPQASTLLQWDNASAVGENVTRESEGEPFDIRRVDLFGSPGYLISIPSGRIAAVKGSLIRLGVPEGSPELFEILRVEAGFPRYGVDITDDYLAQEVARTKHCISFNKGCYLGQETVARLDALGHTNRELRRLRLATSVIPAAGSPVFDESGTHEIGVITSAAPDLEDSAADSGNSVVALGLLKRSALKTDTLLTVKTSTEAVAGRVL
jgi:tRNA-modifying protein YgfZ